MARGKGIDFTKQPVEVRLAAHAIGLNHKRPYTRKGHRYYRAWRNYYTASGESPEWKTWEDLCHWGYATCDPPSKNMSLFMFHLTPAGLAWLGSVLGITIHRKGT